MVPFHLSPILVPALATPGHPKVGCDINATMTRSDFRFGSAVNQHVWYGLHNGVNASIYRQEFLRLFNTAVFEGEMKWPEWEADAPSHNQTVSRIPSQLHPLMSSLSARLDISVLRSWS